jgi:hypothetical protein
LIDPITPGGRVPDKVAPVATPPNVYFMDGDIAVPVHIVCIGVPTDKFSVGNGFTVIVPPNDTVPQLPPVVVNV